MALSSAIFFSVAFVFYLVTWVYIRQLVRDVNGDATGPHVSIWRWIKAWCRHRLLFPTSSVRKRLATCIGLTVIFGLIGFVIQARLMSLRQ